VGAGPELVEVTPPALVGAALVALEVVGTTLVALEVELGGGGAALEEVAREVVDETGGGGAVPGRHWEYQGLPTVQTEPVAQQVGPDQPLPPHCPLR
jgi:hypothetical protein